jgi:hypothetical protein
MTSLLREEALGVERERGLGTTGEDTRVSGTERVRNPLLGEAAAQWRFAAGRSCGRRRFFNTELSCDLADSSDLWLSFDESGRV